MKLRTLIGGLALLALAGCASTPGASGPQSELLVRVDNNLIPPRTLTVYLMPRDGIERNLGDIIGSGVQVLRYRGLSLQGEYQFVARVSGTNLAVLSNIIVLDRVRTIDWDLLRNYLEITSVDE